MSRAPPLAETPVLVQRFEELVHDYARLVHSVVLRIGGSAAAGFGDDIEQRVFLEIWKQVSHEQEIKSPSSYIYRAAVRETVRLLKQERRHELPDHGTDDAREATRASAANPGEQLQSRELAAKIRQGIDSLAAERQKAVRAHLAGLRVQEIMRLQNWSYNKARNLVARGMADLRRDLQKRGVHA